jgi:hypothetical protein
VAVPLTLNATADVRGAWPTSGFGLTARYNVTGGGSVAVGGTGVGTTGSSVAVGVADGYHGRGVRVGVGVGHSGHTGHVAVAVAVGVRVGQPGQTGCPAIAVATAADTVPWISRVCVGVNVDAEPDPCDNRITNAVTARSPRHTVTTSATVVNFHALVIGFSFLFLCKNQKFLS